MSEDDALRRSSELPLQAEHEARESLHQRAPGHPKIIAFDDLPHCGEEVWISNGGKLYRLRRTRQGKLILTK